MGKYQKSVINVYIIFISKRNNKSFLIFAYKYQLIIPKMKEKKCKVILILVRKEILLGDLENGSLMLFLTFSMVHC